MDGLTATEQAAVGGAVFATGAISVIIGFIAYVLLVIAQWKIFTKMGEPGWKSLIPFYNVYVQFEHTWQGIYGILAVVLIAVGQMLTGPGNTMPQEMGFTAILGLCASIAGAALWIIGLYKLAKAFGKGIGFFLLLMFLQVIGLLILGFGSAQYIGKQE